MAAKVAPITNYNRKCVMVWAWDLKRVDPSRDFAGCLRAAWVAVKAYIARRAKAMAKFVRAVRAGGRIALSPSLIRSPSTGQFAGTRFGRTSDRHAGQMISRMGR
jgi:hypothetical protein